jgi:hypothetical protein
MKAVRYLQKRSDLRYTVEKTMLIELSEGSERAAPARTQVRIFVNLFVIYTTL